MKLNEAERIVVSGLLSVARGFRVSSSSPMVAERAAVWEQQLEQKLAALDEPEVSASETNAVTGEEDLDEAVNFSQVVKPKPAAAEGDVEGKEQ